MMACLDASVIVKWYFDEELADEALPFRLAYERGDLALVVPDLAVHECLSAIRAKFARGDCDLDGARDAAGDIIRLEWQLVPGSVLARQTLELSLARHRLWTYDASYLALAQSLGVEFWTADRRLAHAVSDLPFVKLLGRDEFGYTDPSHPEASS